MVITMLIIKLNNMDVYILLSLQVSATQKWSIGSYFDELAENYLQARMPEMPGRAISYMPLPYCIYYLSDAKSDCGLEHWGKSFNGLTQLTKFKELGTLLYGDPAQGPSIVSR